LTIAGDDILTLHSQRQQPPTVMGKVEKQFSR